MIIIIFNLLYFIVFLLLSCFVLVYWFGLHWFFSLILIVFEVIVLCLINTNKYKTTLFPSQINNKINVKEKGGGGGVGTFGCIPIRRLQRKGTFYTFVPLFLILYLLLFRFICLPNCFLFLFLFLFPHREDPRALAPNQVECRFLAKPHLAK
jgi:hypothetical protein